MRTATIGHNNPPSDIEILRERLNEEYQQEQQRLEELSGKEFSVVENEEQAGSVSEYIKAVKTFKKRISDIHRAEKDPYLNCGKEVDLWKKNFEIKIDALIKKAEGPLNAFLQKKAEEERKRQLEIARQAREEAEALAREAEAHAQEGIHDTANELMDGAISAEQYAQKITSSALDQKGRARSVTGASASQKLVWTGEIESLPGVDLEKLRQYFTEDSIQKAINAAIRDGVREIPGVKIYQKSTVMVR